MTINKKIKVFRNSASFGKRMEFWIIGRMLKEGLDIYVPLVDDMGIDAVIRRKNGTFTEVQIKARSDDVKIGNCALFAGLKHEERKNYWFVFYSERIDVMWIMTSEEFVKEARQNKSGYNLGKRTLKFNGCRKGNEYALPKYEQYIATDFSRIVQ